jgi:hypothetical protein
VRDNHKTFGKETLRSQSTQHGATQLEPTRVEPLVEEQTAKQPKEGRSSDMTLITSRPREAFAAKAAKIDPTIESAATLHSMA